MLENKIAKSASEWPEINKSIIGHGHEKIKIKYENRFSSIDSYILYTFQRKSSPHNPEYYNYMKNFILKNATNHIENALLYMKICTINRKIRLGIIKNESDLLNFIR